MGQSGELVRGRDLLSDDIVVSGGTHRPVRQSRGGVSYSDLAALISIMTPRARVGLGPLGPHKQIECKSCGAKRDYGVRCPYCGS